MPRADGTTQFRVTAANTGTTEVLAARPDARLSLLLQCETELCRVTFDGTTASATNGLRMAVGDSVFWGFQDGPPCRSAIKAWSSGGTGIINGVETHLG